MATFLPVVVIANKKQAEICKIILDEGDLQISDKERQVNLENMLKDIATTIAAKCVNPSSNRPYPVTVIEKVTMCFCPFSPSWIDPVVLIYIYIYICMSVVCPLTHAMYTVVCLACVRP